MIKFTFYFLGFLRLPFNKIYIRGYINLKNFRKFLAAIQRHKVVTIDVF